MENNLDKLDLEKGKTKFFKARSKCQMVYKPTENYCFQINEFLPDMNKTF